MALGVTPQAEHTFLSRDYMSMKPHLTNLPIEIQQLIFDKFLSSNGPAWLPWYTDYQSYSGNLQRKHIEYYGPWSPDREKQPKSLLNLSCTCKYFRELLVPRLFKTIVLRSRPKSVASIEALQKTVIWSYVQELYFAGTWDKVQQESRDWTGVVSVGAFSTGDLMWQQVDAEMKRLTDILGDLPPNLTSLVLDFPQGWNDDYDTTIFMDDDSLYYDGCHVDRYRILLDCVLGAISSNDISSKTEFQLKVLGFPPLCFNAHRSEGFRAFMHNVTDFTLGLCSYEAERTVDDSETFLLNTLSIAQERASDLSTFFFDHLLKAKSLNVLGDRTWPLGSIGDGLFHCALPLPPMSHIMSNLSTLSLKQIFICPELVDFLVVHRNTLVSVELTDSAAYSHVDLNFTPDLLSWGDLFQALVLSDPQKLCRFNIVYEDFTQDQLTDCSNPTADWEVKRERVRSILKIQDNEVRCARDGDEIVTINRNRRVIFPYCGIDLHHGIKFNTPKANITHFLEGRDHEYWMRLVDIMETNLNRRVCNAD